MVMLARQVRTKATELDVYVDGKRVGRVTDCADCWRVYLYDRRRKYRQFPTYETRAEAIRALVNAGAQ